MRNRLIAILSTLALFAGVSWFSVVHAQIAGHEPHMDAAMVHLRQAKAELEKATPNKGGHREKAIELVDQAMQQVEEGEKYGTEHPGK